MADRRVPSNHPTIPETIAGRIRLQFPSGCVLVSNMASYFEVKEARCLVV